MLVCCAFVSHKPPASWFLVFCVLCGRALMRRQHIDVVSVCYYLVLGNTSIMFSMPRAG